MPKRDHKQKRRPDIPERHHVARHCNPQRIIRNVATGAIDGVFPSAFELRTALNERYLSTHWMEFFGVDIDAQFRAVAQALRNKGRTLMPRSAIAQLNAGRVVDAGKARGHSLRIRDRSSAADPGYAGIFGMPLDNRDLELLAMLADECCIAVRGVANI